MNKQGSSVRGDYFADNNERLLRLERDDGRAIWLKVIDDGLKVVPIARATIYENQYQEQPYD